MIPRDLRGRSAGRLRDAFLRCPTWASRVSMAVLPVATTHRRSIPASRLRPRRHGARDRCGSEQPWRNGPLHVGLPWRRWACALLSFSGVRVDRGVVRRRGGLPTPVASRYMLNTVASRRAVPRRVHGFLSTPSQMRSPTRRCGGRRWCGSSGCIGMRPSHGGHHAAPGTVVTVAGDRAQAAAGSTASLGS